MTLSLPPMPYQREDYEPLSSPIAGRSVRARKSLEKMAPVMKSDFPSDGFLPNDGHVRSCFSRLRVDPAHLPWHEIRPSRKTCESASTGVRCFRQIVDPQRLCQIEARIFERHLKSPHQVPLLQSRINPPSTTSVCPVTKRASSLVKKATGPAMSAGVPSRLIACIM